MSDMVLNGPPQGEPPPPPKSKHVLMRVPVDERGTWRVGDRFPGYRIGRVLENLLPRLEVSGHATVVALSVPDATVTTVGEGWVEVRLSS